VPARNVVILRRSGQIQGYRDHCTSPHWGVQSRG